VIHASEVTIHDGETSMKIEKIDIKNSQVNFADRIDSLEYHNGLEISRSDFEQLKMAIKNLSESELKTLAEETNVNQDAVEQKAAAGARIKAFLGLHGVAIAQNLTASVIFETARYLLFK
jgi:hypothetical protein